MERIGYDIQADAVELALDRLPLTLQVAGPTRNYLCGRMWEAVYPERRMTSTAGPG